MVRTGQKYTVRKRLLMVSAIFNDCLDIHVVFLFTCTCMCIVLINNRFVCDLSDCLYRQWVINNRFVCDLSDCLYRQWVSNH